MEGIWGKGGAERWGRCLWDWGLAIWEMGVVGGGLMWGMDMGVGSSGCSRGGCPMLWEEDWDGGVWDLSCDWPAMEEGES